MGEIASRPTEESARPRTGLLIVGVVILLVVALVASMCSMPGDNRALPTKGEAKVWFEPIWDDGTALFRDVCTQGVCVADLVALPARRPVEAVIDLEMAETLGAMSVERLWTGERGGLFGSGWESIWDIALVDQRLTGPLPGFPLVAPEAGTEVPLDDGTTLRLDDQGLLESVCADGALCITAKRSKSAIVLSTSDDDGSAGEATVTLSLEEGRVVAASTASGRSTSYAYADDRLASVYGDGDPIKYSYDGGGRLVVIDDGHLRSFVYDAGLVTATTDRAGGLWQIGGNDGDLRVTSIEGWRVYRFDGSLLMGVEDSALGTLVARTVSRGIVTSEERPIDGVTTTRLDDGRLMVSQERNGAPARKAFFTVDERGRVIRSESPDGTTVVTYDGSSHRPSLVEHKGARTKLDYDDRGLLMSTVDADGYQVEITRDSSGLPTRITDGIVAHEFSYDEAGRVIGEGSPEAQSTATYDDNGLLATMVDAAGRTFIPTYDGHSRLAGISSPDGDLGGSVEETFSALGGSEPSPSVEVLASEPAANGGTTFSYASGGSATFDAAGRVLSMTVGGRTTTREYDDSGRVSTVRLPDGTEYSADYSSAGRVVSIRSGQESANLTWHGDLLTEARTSAGSVYRYEYDSAGNLVSASEGAARWLYEYNRSGLVTKVDGPAGTSLYSWDDLGRPTRAQAPGADREFTWDGNEFDLAGLTESGEQVLKVEREEGRVVAVTSLVDDKEQEITFEYDGVGRVTRYQISDTKETSITYRDGRVATIDNGGHQETWEWDNNEVTRVTVGDDEYEFEWVSPGILGKVTKGDKVLVRVDVDSRGRPTAVFSDKDEPMAEFSWTAARLATASFDDWDLALSYDDEQRLIGVDRKGQASSWSYTQGALTRFEVVGDVTQFEYGGDGHLTKSVRQVSDDDDQQQTITWDAGGSRPIQVDSKVGQVSFSYGRDGTVNEITVADDDPEKVEVSGDKVRADGDAGKILGDLFDESGYFDIARGVFVDGPVAPWFAQLPAEFGLDLPDVVTGDDVVSTATADLFPDTPVPLVPSGNLAAATARPLIAIATGASVPLGPGRVMDLDLGPDGGNVEDLVGASPTFAIVQSLERHMGPGPSLWERFVDFGGDLVGGITSAGSATWGFLTKNPVGRAVMSAMFMVGTFVGAVACGVSVVCAAGVGVAFFVLGGFMDTDASGIVASLTRSALQPLTDLRNATNGDPLALLSTAGLAIALGAGIFAMPLARTLPSRALASICSLKRIVCMSVSHYGEAAEHVVDAQRHGASRMLRIDREGAAARRSSALRHVDARAGFDRDEYPFAVSSRRAGLSVRYIDPASNRSLGSYLGHQLSPLPDGARFFVLPIT